MAGITAAPATGLYTNEAQIGAGTALQITALTQRDLNNFRISAVIDRLSMHFSSNNKNDKEFDNLCLSLSRGIDFCIANNYVPIKSSALPSLIKQMGQIKNDATTQAAIMVLMISVKNGWFPDQDSAELRNLEKEVARNFCSALDFSADPNPSHPVISTVMSRFYPRLRMGHIFVFLEIKPGFEAYVSDFQISKRKCAPGDRIRLLVVQTDNIDTPSCLVTPAKVNFLLNGKGVERRTNLFVDTGPQVPTVVTPLLKYGSNLLQAVGEFNGNYIIIVAFMSEVPNLDSNTLQDCEQYAPATVDAVSFLLYVDSEVIEGSSRISLNCPISFARIKIPVKGISCKHIQCFDFDNYVDMNSRRPSWRCPHCNQHVCFSDIRIDQKMVKILKEVRPNVSDIIVSSDGSWNAAVGSEETTEKSEDKTLNTGRDESPQPEEILDLTLTDDPMDVFDASGSEDRKHFSMANAHSTSINPHLASANDANQSRTHTESDDFWSGVHRSSFGQGTLDVRSNAQTVSPSASTSNLANVGAFHHNAVATTSAPQIGTPMPQYQQYQLGNSPVISDYGRPSAVNRHITRTASAVQGLPAISSTPILQRSSSANAASSPLTPNGLSAASQASLATSNLTSNHASSHQVPPGSYSSTLPQYPSTQQNRPFPFAQSSPQNTGFLDPNQVPNMYTVSNEHQSFSQPTNFRIPRSMSNFSSTLQPSVQPSTNVMRHQSHAGVASTQHLNVPRTGVASNSTQQAQWRSTANRTAQMSVGASRAVPSNSSSHNIPTPIADQRVSDRAIPPPQPVTTIQDSVDPNWRPPGRMRGALLGQAYEDAMNQYIIQPTQQAQARPISNPMALPNIRSTLPAFMGGGNAQGSRAPNSTSAAPSGRPAGTDILPSGSTKMH
ncbi:E4 SUMO-protein ligase PIAL2-like isoform X2 [Salvia hispanica]|uniref:E4 SUMO-protein ligase PIAL2-like isoform X2 n=1 Tax=Salvia hispanica TaxID=49212 RepID=UPI00200928F4|nr:E4 SUMO-protein ligase PIAL2-like isoform X2 [Salvia hispanica]